MNCEQYDYMQSRSAFGFYALHISTDCIYLEG
nr:MAG TPA: hypothetical protein [Caudoviricetes sp.]